MAFLLLWRQQRKEKKKKQIQEENLRLTIEKNENISTKKEEIKEEKFDDDMKIYLFITLWISILLIGCIPSINSYSLNPYGAATFHYVLILCKLSFFFVFKFFYFFS